MLISIFSLFLERKFENLAHVQVMDATNINYELFVFLFIKKNVACDIIWLSLKKKLQVGNATL